MPENTKGKSKNHQRIGIILFLVVAVLVAWGVKSIMSYKATNGVFANPETKHKAFATASEDFAKCLNEQGAIMYGIDTCEYCQTQKKMFGSAFDQIKYINCYFEKDQCSTAGVQGYPFWQIGDKKISGIQTFSSLAAISGCKEPDKI